MMSFINHANPIVALEKRALARTPVFRLRQPPRKQFAQLGWAFRWVALTLAVGLYLLTLVAAVFNLDLTRLLNNDYFQDVLLMLALFSAVEWLSLTFGALVIASRSITRESQHEQHWALLRLSGVSAYRLVWGKGLGLMAHLWETIVYVTVLRVALSLVFYYNTYLLMLSQDRFVPPPLPALIVLPALMLLFTVALVAAALAVGLLVSAVSRVPLRAQVLSGPVFIGLWFAIGFITLQLSRWFTRLRWTNESSLTLVPILLTESMFTVLDGGMTLTGSMLDYQHPSPYLEGMGGQLFDNLPIYLIAAVLVMGFYAALIVSLTRLTAWFLQRRGVSS